MATDSDPTLKVAERTEFGSRSTRRLRRDGLVPGVVYGGGGEARATSRSPSASCATSSSTAAPCRRRARAARRRPVVIKEQQRHPVRGHLMHLDLLEVKLDEAIEAEVAIELLGAEDAPGVKEGGVLEHVTHEITISALPTEIPESIAADVSGMEIGDTLQLVDGPAPEGVEFASARTSTPRRSRSRPSRRRASRRSPRSSRRRPSSSARTASRSSPTRAPRARSAADGEAGDAGDAGERLGDDGARSSPAPVRPAAVGDGPTSDRAVRRRVLVVGLGNPGAKYAAHAAQRRLRGRRRAVAALGPAQGEGEVPGPDHRGPGRARRAARRGAAAPDLHERVRRLGRPGARRACECRSSG